MLKAAGYHGTCSPIPNEVGTKELDVNTLQIRLRAKKTKKMYLSLGTSFCPTVKPAIKVYAIVKGSNLIKGDVVKQSYIQEDK